MIVTELMGGMGNQMFQYALGRHLAIKHNTKLYLDTKFLLDRTPKKKFVYRNYDLDIFNISAQIVSPKISENYSLSRRKIKKAIQKLIPPNQLLRVDEKFFRFNKEVFKTPDNIYLNGYWQTEKYFEPISEIIRTDFTFKNSMNYKSQELSIKIKACNAICLNVRRGDFITNPTHGTLGTDYYLKAETYLLNYISNPVIYVFSDEIDWCKKHIVLASQTYYVDHEFSGGKFRDYLELMSHCKHFIIPNSSFAWWAAWLCNNPDKIIVAPKIWFPDGKWDARDVVPQDWIKM